MNCGICTAIAEIQAGKHPFFVAELEASYVVLSRHQFFRGYTLLYSKQHARELHELSKGERLCFLDEMSRVAEAVHRWVQPVKLNYIMLGNVEPHLHWHVVPRHANDPKPKASLWEIEPQLREAPASVPGAEQLADMKAELRALLT